ncbi:GNAT family N-acetyltransferase [Paenibacillus sp. NFR01]|uniref:GNAT family N-acetyltransferase n=1 Tax=Paenibacillus sp. NFR01 TaxID=1566279 RepID=UPI000B8695C3|nr:GNAT family N-acetyltransferase [Paenibacillus sp. NFR01]
MMITLRRLIPADAAELLTLQHRLDDETSFMLLEPGERQSGLQQVQDMIQGFERADNSILIGAEADGKLAGYLSLRGGSVKRNRHSAYLVIGILQEFQGIGVGAALFQEMENWAKGAGLIRLELTVMTHNTKALALYAKCGFEIEGTKRKSLRIGEAWVDEYYMSKILAD